MKRINDIQKLTDTPYVNLYAFDATFRDGRQGAYYVASRSKTSLSLVTTV